jgi:hypothetical protein
VLLNLAEDIIRDLGTRKQREVLGLESDDQPAPQIPTANGAAA